MTSRYVLALVDCFREENPLHVLDTMEQAGRLWAMEYEDYIRY